MNAQQLAEVIIDSLNENDKFQQAEMMGDSTEHKSVIGVETDTGELFFVELYPA